MSINFLCKNKNFLLTESILSDIIWYINEKEVILMAKAKLKIKVKQVENILIFKTKDDINLLAYHLVKTIDSLNVADKTRDYIEDVILSVLELNPKMFSFSLPNNELTQIFVETLSSWKEVELKPMKLKELLDKN